MERCASVRSTIRSLRTWRHFSFPAPSHAAHAKEPVCSPPTPRVSMRVSAHRSSRHGRSTDRSGVLPTNALNTIFAGALMRRFAGLGPSGIDAIYAMNGSTGVATTFTTAIDAGTADPEGTCTDDTCRDFLDADDRNRDIDAYSQVGTVGWGDLSMSADDRTLFAVNLFDKKLYKFPLTATGTTAGAAVGETIPDPACTNGTSRPWANTVKDGMVYVGVVCDASSVGGARSDLAAFVYAYNPASTAVAMPDGSLIAADSWSETCSPMRRPRQGTQLDFDRACSARISGTCRSTGPSTHWNPWSNDPVHELNLLTLPIETRGYHQPVLVDLEFADDGGFILSFGDRWAWQSSGHKHYPPISGSTTEVQNGQVGGDIVRTSYQSAGVFTVENGGVVAQNPALGTGSLSGWSNSPGVIAGAVGGPGGGEFFNDDAIDDSGSGFWVHAESPEGGVAKIPGNPEIAFKALDPDDDLFTHGIAYVFETNGLRRGNQTGGTLGVAAAGFRGSNVATRSSAKPASTVGSAREPASPIWKCSLRLHRSRSATACGTTPTRTGTRTRANCPSRACPSRSPSERRRSLLPLTSPVSIDSPRRLERMTPATSTGSLR